MKSIRILNDLFLAYMKNLYPEIPPDLLSFKPIKADSANELTKGEIKFSIYPEARPKAYQSPAGS